MQIFNVKQPSQGRHDFWHDASWNYVLWGLYYLVCLVVEKYLLKKHMNKIPLFIRWLCSILIIIFGWVLFRAENLTQVVSYIRTMLGIGDVLDGMNDFIANILNYRAFWIAGLIGSMPFMRNLGNRLCEKYRDSALFLTVQFFFVFLIFLLCVVYIIASSYNAFIYFQF